MGLVMGFGCNNGSLSQRKFRLGEHRVAAQAE